MSVSLLVGLLPYFNYRNIGISPVLDEICFWKFLETFLRCWYTSSKYFLNLCMSVSLFVGLQILNKYRHIICSDWDIFLKLFWHISGMFAHFFQIVTNFLYVCQSVRWIAYLLKLGQYRDISCPGWDRFLKILGGILGIFLNHIQIITYFHMSVIHLVCLLL